MKMKTDCLPLHLLCSRNATLHILFCLRFLFLVFTISISCLPPSSRACPEPFQCGNQTFTYPFGKKNSGCGDPALQLECDTDNMTILTIGDHQYCVVQQFGPSKDYPINQMGIVDRNMWGDKCDPSTSNHTMELWSNPHFRISDENINVSLWGDCAEDIAESLPGGAKLHPLYCNKTWYYSEFDLGPYCKSWVQLPVEKLPESNNQPFLPSIYIEFKINWNLGEGCEYCESEEKLCIYKVTNPTQWSCKSPGTKSARSIILGCSIGGGALIAVIIVLIYFMRRRKRSSRRESSSEFSNYEGSGIEKGEKGYMLGSVRIFSYQELQEATNFFDKNNELGDGGFGTVYLGKVEDGRTVAVKRLYQENSRRFEQFINEVEILSSLNHPNLVRLYGCTSPESPVLLLVYEFVSNGTLADHLHGSRRSLRGLPWGIRLNIALQTAQALAYLHSIEPPIFHRDVKSNNILLDEHLRAKVADFGLSRLVPLNVSHVTTAPQGTPGYVDPEYRQCFQLSDKSDVYSFGVVLVELISAKVAVDIMRNRSEISLANMAMDKMRRGVLNELVDPDLKIESNPEVKAMVFAVAELAFECLSRERDFRPSMKDVVSRLEQIREMQEKSRESSKLTSFVPIASPLSAPIMGSHMTGQYWAPMSL